jgi:hypothetical protein
MMRPRLRSACAALALAALAAAPLAAQRTHVLIITGLGGEPRYSRAFVEQGTALHDLARTQWRVADSSLVWLAEDPARDPARIRGRSTREAVGEAFLTLSRRVSAGDVLVVMLIGHGSGEGNGSRVNLPGADPTAADYADWLAGFGRQTVVFVNAASASGDFVPALRGESRVIVTATRGPFERNETLFGTHFVRGLTSAEADADKDGRVSVLEAFTYATREVARAYAADQRLLTEHAQVSDSTLASRVAFGGAAASDDPRVVALVAERRALEEQLAALRGRKDTMPPAAYEQELERLLVAIAEKTREIRAAGGRP